METVTERGTIRAPSPTTGFETSDYTLTSLEEPKPTLYRLRSSSKDIDLGQWIERDAQVKGEVLPEAPPGAGVPLLDVQDVRKLDDV